MEVTQTLISLDERSKWEKVLELVPHAFAHTWDSCHAMSKTSGYHTSLYLFHREETFIVCPIAERVFNGYVDIVTPYGFSGIVSNRQCPEFSTYWYNFVKQRGYVCGYIGLNPLFENNYIFSGMQTYCNNEIFVLDLTISMDQLVKNLSANRKRELKDSNKNDYKIINSKKELHDYFMAHFSSFFSQRPHSNAYNLTTETLRLLIDSDKVYMNGIYNDSEIKGAAMFAYTPHCGEYMFYISDEKKYTAALIWDAVKHLKMLGVSYLNLGGGVVKGDSIAEFKRRFGGLSFPLNALKQVYDSDVYRKLCDQSGNSIDETDYFPAYRANNLQST